MECWRCWIGWVITGSGGGLCVPWVKRRDEENGGYWSLTRSLTKGSYYIKRDKGLEVI